MDLGTADAVTALFFLKMKQDIPYDVLGIMYGGAVDTTMMRWFYLVLDFVYSNLPVLTRSRNLTGQNHLGDILEELHGATMRNTRFSTTFTPTMIEAMRVNPQLGQLKLVGICWDSRHLLVPHSINFNFQKRTFSTKIGDNAIVKLAACGLDSIQKFIYLTTCSISPTHADGAICRYVMDLEANQGENENGKSRK
jgi:hypothetical protein